MAMSQAQGLSQLTSGMEKIAAATLKNQEIVVERDLKRKEMYLASRQEDAELRAQTKNCRNVCKDVFQRNATQCFTKSH